MDFLSPSYWLSKVRAPSEQRGGDDGGERETGRQAQSDETEENNDPADDSSSYVQSGEPNVVSERQGEDKCEEAVVEEGSREQAAHEAHAERQDIHRKGRWKMLKVNQVVVLE